MCSQGCGFHDLAEDSEDLSFEVEFETPDEGIPFEGPVSLTQAQEWAAALADLENAVEPSPTNWRALTLPQGWSWYRLPSSSGAAGVLTSINVANGVLFPRDVTALRSWAAENNLVVAPSRVQAVAIPTGYARRPFRVTIRNEGDPPRFPTLDWEEEFTCPLCGETHPAYTIICPAADSRRPILCSNCQFFRADLRDVGDPGYPTYLCSECRHECEDEGCEEDAFDNRFCEEHGHSAACFHCDSWIELHIEDEFIRDGNGEIVCVDCSTRCCGVCGNYSRRSLNYVEDTGLYLCRRCFLGADDAEAFDEEASAELTIPAIPGRENIRLCGVEIEGGNGEGNGQTLAAAFHNAGLSEWDRMGGYHSGSEGGFAHVERDSSVDWEAVIGPIDPADEHDVERLDEAIKTIRSLVRENTLTLDLRAGCHIHVEAARTSLDGAYNLNLLFAYMEDVIFRLGAARWPVHRAVQDTHYTQPIPKELRKVQFAREHAESDNARYYALSFNNYFTQMFGRCRCGAVRYDSWADCTCELGKCTFEFRVFNTTANPRKLHAYLALSQALVAKAMSMERVEANDFPALSFVARRFKDMDGSAQEELVTSWQERLGFLFNELPLTNDEKASLAYCVRHSELEAVGEEFIESLLPAQQVIQEVTA